MGAEGFTLAQSVWLILFSGIFAGAGLTIGGLLSLMVRRARDEAERNNRDGLR